MITAWPSALVARPQLIADAHAIELRDAWFSAEREHHANVEAGRYPAPDVARYQVIDGIAVIPVSGVLLNRYNLLGDGSPYTSYPALTREVNRAADDPSIRGIILAISSPGGTADGILAPAAAIRAARAKKPVKALVGSIAASGGYWLAAQADEIILQDDFSTVGSIGVYTMHMDISKLLERAGVDISVISSGAHKVDGHPFAPLPDSVRKDIQNEVDDLRLMFAREVAAGRPALPERAALATEARIFPALHPKTGRRPAIEAKLADRVATLPAVLAGLAAGIPPKPAKSRGVVAVDENAIRAAERTRISEIMSSQHAAGREAQAQYLALSTSMSAAEAVGFLAEAPKAEAAAPRQTYEQRKAETGGLSYVDTGAPTSQARAASGWGKAVAAANKGLGPGVQGGKS